MYTPAAWLTGVDTGLVCAGELGTHGKGGARCPVPVCVVLCGVFVCVCVIVCVCARACVCVLLHAKLFVCCFSHLGRALDLVAQTSKRLLITKTLTTCSNTLQQKQAHACAYLHNQGLVSLPAKQYVILIAHKHHKFIQATSKVQKGHRMSNTRVLHPRQGTASSAAV